MDKQRSLSLCANMEVAVGIGSVVIGLLLIIAPSTQLFVAYNETIAQAFWNSDSLSELAMNMNHWLLATCGAGVVGWGIAWATIAHIPFRRGERWAWYCLFVSLVTWVFLDIACALWFGVNGELAFVLVALIVGMLPLLLSFKNFETVA